MERLTASLEQNKEILRLQEQVKRISETFNSYDAFVGRWLIERNGGKLRPLTEEESKKPFTKGELERLEFYNEWFKEHQEEDDENYVNVED